VSVEEWKLDRSPENEPIKSMADNQWQTQLTKEQWRSEETNICLNHRDEMEEQCTGSYPESGLSLGAEDFPVGHFHETQEK